MNTRYKNSFIRAALEELDEPAVTEVVVDSSTDAVAELMEKNTTLETNNTELEEESFDNDVSAIAGASDSTHADLDEAVNAGAALEALAELCNLTVKGKFANKATVASHVFALEQITSSLRMPSQIPALEALALPNGAAAPTSADEQTKSVGAKALDIAKNIGKKLAEGIKRIIGWLMSVLRNLVASSAKIEKRAEDAFKLIDTIDATKKITAGPFIASLRLVEGGGDVNAQFTEYFKLADASLNGFFNKSFTQHMHNAFVGNDTPKMAQIKLAKVTQSAMDIMFTEHGDASDVTSEIPESISDQELSVGLTKPCIGGLQLFLATTHADANKWFCRAGVAKKELKFDTPSEIPTADKTMARLALKSATNLVKSHKQFESNLSEIERKGSALSDGSAEVDTASLSAYLTTLAAFATSVAPNLLRLNMKNASALVAFVEKSISVSKPDAAPKEDKKD